MRNVNILLFEIILDFCSYNSEKKLLQLHNSIHTMFVQYMNAEKKCISTFYSAYLMYDKITEIVYKQKIHKSKLYHTPIVSIQNTSL